MKNSWMRRLAAGFTAIALLVSFALMFIREELEENPVIEKDLTAIRQETREIDRTLKRELQEEMQRNM